MAHEQQKRSMEEEFEKLRLSLQVLHVLTLNANMCVVFMRARVKGCVSLLCLGSGGHVDISEPHSARPSQAF